MSNYFPKVCNCLFIKYFLHLREAFVLKLRNIMFCLAASLYFFGFLHWCFTSHSTEFQLRHGDDHYGEMKPDTG